MIAGLQIGRRTLERQLGPAQLKAQKAKSKIRNRERQRVSGRQLVIGRQLLAAAANDAEVQRVLDRLIGLLSAPADRALFNLQPLDIDAMETSLWDRIDEFSAAQERGDRASAAAASRATVDQILAWEKATGRLWPERSASWEKVPGSRRPQ